MPAHKPRLLYVVNDPTFFLSHRRALAEAARREGYEVHVAAPGADAAQDLVACGFTLHSIPLRRRSLNPLVEAQTLTHLIRLYHSVRPDLVHHVTIKPVIHGGIASRIAGVPAVVNAITGLGWTFTRSGARGMAVRQLLKVAYRGAFGHRNQYTIFQNHDDQGTFVRGRLVAANTTVVIPGSGVDPDYWTAMSEETEESPALVVLPARLLWDKGIETFVQAAELLRGQGVQAAFAVAGAADPGNRSHIPHEQIDAWKRSGAVEFLGRRSDMRALYRRAAIVCLPSRREGLPRALLEAASCERAIVTTDAPGCRDVVEHGRTGLIVPPDRPQELAVALNELLADPERRRRFGAAARRRVIEQFSEQRVIRDTLDVYLQALAGPRPSLTPRAPTVAQEVQS